MYTGDEREVNMVSGGGEVENPCEVSAERLGC